MDATTSFLVAHAPLIAITIFIVVSASLLCFTMDGLWVASTCTLMSVIIADSYLMYRSANSDTARVDWVMNADIMRCALTLMHAYPLICITHLSTHPRTQNRVMFGVLMMCIIKSNETTCVGDYTHTDTVTFNAYGLLVDSVCIIMTMSYMLYDISVLRNTRGCCLYSTVFVSQFIGSCLLNTQFKYCNTYVTFYTHFMGIGTELMLFCYLLLLASSYANSVVHCIKCPACISTDGCLSCGTCNGFATVNMWKNSYGDIVTQNNTQAILTPEPEGVTIVDLPSQQTLSTLPRNTY
jgi:hypothetical protein